MRRWFLSYNSADEALARGVKLAIELAEPGAQVFFAPEHLRAGFWSRELAREIARADVFLLLIGKGDVGPWQVVEYNEALDRKVKSPTFQLVVVLLEGQVAPGLPFLSQLHWIIAADPTAQHAVARLLEAAAGQGGPAGALWRHAAPYRGLLAMEEADSDFFFGRARETVEVLALLASRGDRFPLLLGNSGVGKSSVARAGVLAALKRQAWPEGAAAGEAGPWPARFAESRGWCYLTLKPGDDPIEALAACFIEAWHWKLGPTDPERLKARHDWVDVLRDPRTTLSHLVEATDRHYEASERERPPAYLIYVDQGEELFLRSDRDAHERFSALLAAGLADPRLFALMSLRADFVGELQKDQRLYESHLLVNVPPLREEQLAEVVRLPAERLGARFDDSDLATTIARKTAADSVRDAGALPMLSYTLDDMWRRMVARGDGMLRLAAASFEPSGVLVERAERFLADRPRDEATLRRILTLRLAAMREGERPTRRRAPRSEFSDDEWRLVSELAGYPYRLLAVVSPEGSEAQVEVAHETLFERWGRLREWITDQQQFLSWRGGVETARKAWEKTEEATKSEAVLMGVALMQARSWIVSRRSDLADADAAFIDASFARDDARRRRAQRGQALIYVLLVGIIVILGGVIMRDRISPHWYWYTKALPLKWDAFDQHVLTSAVERVLQPGQAFRECSENCPEMKVVPAGSSVSRPRAPGRPPIPISIGAFAVSTSSIVIREWNECVAVYGCEAIWQRYGHAPKSIKIVNWHDAQQYARWLSRMTGKSYRLLDEVEWDYLFKLGVGGTPGEKEWVEDCYSGSWDVDDDILRQSRDKTSLQSPECYERVVRTWPNEKESKVLRDGYEHLYRNAGFRVVRILGQ
jgi:formylglycine-generating enzyme required for sulfatase activity